MPGGPLLTICSVSGKDMGQQVPPHAFTCLYRTATRTATLAQDLRGVSQQSQDLVPGPFETQG